MPNPSKPTKFKLEKTSDLISRHKNILWARFALRAIVVSIAIAIGALLFRDLDLVPDLSYVDLNILSGNEEGQYHKIVANLAQSAVAKEAVIRNIPSQGSRDNLERLKAARKSCDVHLGLVQDGFDRSMYQGLKLIGRVGRPESLLILGRNGDDVKRLVDLKGLKIGIGPEGSGAAFLAERLLHAPEFASLNIQLQHHPLQQQVELAANGKLDLALFVMDEDAQLIDNAVREKGLQVVGFEHSEALARRFPFIYLGEISAGQYDPVKVIPSVAKPILRLDTLLVGNGCAEHSDVVGLMTLLSRADPNFIERNRTIQAPSGLDVAETARDFYENQGAAFADEYVPWLVDIMPPSNWVYTIMAVSLFFNFAGFLNNQRLAMIDLNRVGLENDIALMFGYRVSNEEIKHFDPVKAGRKIDTTELGKLISRYKQHLEKCRRQSLSVISPMGEEMGYRDQEIIMTATIDALRDLHERLVNKNV